MRTIENIEDNDFAITKFLDDYPDFQLYDSYYYDCHDNRLYVNYDNNEAIYLKFVNDKYKAIVGSDKDICPIYDDDRLVLKGYPKTDTYDEIHLFDKVV